MFKDLNSSVSGTFLVSKEYGSVAKTIFLHFDTIIFTFMCHFLSNENDLIS